MNGWSKPLEQADPLPICNSLPSSCILIRQDNARGADRYNITLLNQDQSSSLLTSIRVLYSLFRLYNLALIHSRQLFARKGLVFYNNAITQATFRD